MDLIPMAMTDVQLDEKLLELCEYRQESLVDIKSVIASGANSRVLDFDGNSILHLAVREWSLSDGLIQYLVEQGINVNAKNHAGETAA